MLYPRTPRNGEFLEFSRSIAFWFATYYISFRSFIFIFGDFFTVKETKKECQAENKLPALQTSTTCILYRRHTCHPASYFTFA